VNDEDRRSILAVEVVHSENESDYSDLFKRLQERGLTGVQLVISDDHQGLRKAVDRYFQGASWQRCQVHFMRNLLSKLRKSDRVWVMASLKDVFRAPDRQQAELRLKALVERLSASDPTVADWLLGGWVGNTNGFGFSRVTSSSYPFDERFGAFECGDSSSDACDSNISNRASCLRMVSALCQEQDEEWVTGRRYIDITLLSKNEGGATPVELRRAV